MRPLPPALLAATALALVACRERPSPPPPAPPEAGQPLGDAPPDALPSKPPTLQDLARLHASQAPPLDRCERIDAWAEALRRADAGALPPPPELLEPPEPSVPPMALRLGPLWVPFPSGDYAARLETVDVAGRPRPRLVLTSSDLELSVSMTDAARPLNDAFAPLDGPMPPAPTAATRALFGDAPPTRLSLMRETALPIPPCDPDEVDAALRPLLARTHLRARTTDAHRVTDSLAAPGAVLTARPGGQGLPVWEVDLPAEGMAWRVAYAPRSPEAAAESAARARQVALEPQRAVRPLPAPVWLEDLARAFGGDAAAAGRLLGAPSEGLDAATLQWLRVLGPPPAGDAAP